MRLSSVIAALRRVVSATVRRDRVPVAPPPRSSVYLPARPLDESAHWSRVAGLVAAAVDTAGAISRAQAAALEKIDAADYALAQLLEDLEAVLRPASPALAVVPQSSQAPMAAEPSRIAA